MFIWRLRNIFPSKTSIFTIRTIDWRSLLKSDITTYVFLKIFINFENRFPSMKQLWVAASSFLQKKKKKKKKKKKMVISDEVYFCRTKYTSTSKLFVIFDRSLINFFLWKVLKPKIKVYTLKIAKKADFLLLKT